ncbi:helix-turn-helix domain-containing protein [Actinospica robiniae]|uniref:helix-turn-helix domain-containing protein n=1 Tax=Actinospica robiniae TaxID=304901 RepID=UPI0004290316|nr:helix-turn-helix domain-containing protein [Actinospica robiniae]
MYQERPAQVRGGVLWTSVAAADGDALIVPDGCMDLMWYDGTLQVAGPDSVPFAIRMQAGAASAGLRFAPGTAPSVLGVPAHELLNQRVRLEDLWSAAEARRAAERIADAPDHGVALERLAVELAGRAESTDPLISALTAQAQAGQPVAEMAHRAGLSQRQLLRRCLPAFGYGPKTLARILRVQRALALARSTQRPRFADVAAATGYADQAHLAREIRALTGQPLGAAVKPGA